jgi:hypothetical protein
MLFVEVGNTIFMVLLVLTMSPCKRHCTTSTVGERVVAGYGDDCDIVRSKGTSMEVFEVLEFCVEMLKLPKAALPDP